MGWGSILGKIGGAIGAGVAAPFTGGASLSILPAILGAGGAAAGSMANASAGNRGAEFGGQLDLAQLLTQRDAELQRLRAQADNDYTANQIARERSGMDTRNDAWRKLLAAQHTASPGPSPQLAGQYNIAPRQHTDAERSGADAMTAEVMARLQGGNPIAAIERRTPAFDYDPSKTIDPRLLKPGTGERIGGILAPILTGVGGIAAASQRPPIYGGGPRMGTPGAPILTASDLAWLRAQNPGLVA